MDQIRNFHQIFSWFLGLNSLSLDKEGPWAVDMMAKAISDLYQNLPNQNQITKKEVHINIEAIAEKDYEDVDKVYLRPVLELKDFVCKNIYSDLEDFLIHGSISSQDYSIGWSDLDTYVIVKGETVENPEKLMDFRNKIIEAHNFLKQIDPLQHHGFIFCTSFDLKNYFSHCLPIEVLKESKSLLQRNLLRVEQYRDLDATRDFFVNKVKFFKDCFVLGSMDHHVLNGIQLKENYEERNAMYQMKYFLSVLMSMPAFFLDAMGHSTYKKYSFSKTREITQLDLGIIDSASKVRDKWHSLENHPYNSNYIPLWLENELGYDYFKRSYEICLALQDTLNKDSSV